MAKSFSDGLLNLVKFGNKFYQSETKRHCRPFFIGNEQVGLIPPFVFKYIKKYSSTFCVEPDDTCSVGERVKLSSDLQTFEERSQSIARILNELRSANTDLKALREWRDEDYSIISEASGKILMKMERAATGLFGLRQFGIHINGYVDHSERGLCIWVGKRSATKKTWPGKLDQLTAGGLAYGESVLECVRKEAREEASIPDKLLANIVPVGTCSYYYEDERGLFPECQYVFDLKLPESFEPVNSDGEVQSFQLMTIDEMKEKLVNEEFKFNCALVNIDFFIRHGLITPDKEPNYRYIVENLHVSFPY